MAEVLKVEAHPMVPELQMSCMTFMAIDKHNGTFRVERGLLSDLKNRAGGQASSQSGLA